jgi:outer membrane protein assembly factor BamB
VGDESGAVYKLNHNAELIGQYQFPDAVKCLVADGNWVYVGCDDGNVYDLSGKTPRLAYEINEDIDIFWLDIANGLLAVSDRSGNLSIINYEDEQQWTTKTKGDSAWMVRCDSVGRVFYGDSVGVTAFYGHDDQHKIWQENVGSILFGYLGKTNVYASTTAGKVFSFDKNGKLNNVYVADHSVFSCAASPDEAYIFAGDNYSSIYCFDKNGERLWKLATGCGSAYSMQYFDEKLYIVTTDGSLACIDVSAAAIENAKQGVLQAIKNVAAPNSKAAIVATDVLENAPENATGVLLQCVKQGTKLRVKVLSEGYQPDWFVQFPKNLRTESKIYLVDAIEESSQGGFYRVLGNIYAR